MKKTLQLTIASIAATTAFVLPAHAEAAASPEGGLASLIPILLIMVIFYFLLIRPQQKRMKQHRDLVASISRGDKVLTGGGVYGKVTDVKEDFLKVEIADGVVIRVKRDTVAGLADDTTDSK